MIFCLINTRPNLRMYDISSDKHYTIDRSEVLPSIAPHLKMQHVLEILPQYTHN